MNIRALKFEPCPFLSHPHVQTMIPAFFSMCKDPGSNPMQVLLPDGDRLIVEVTVPSVWKEGDPTVLCVPGFCGCHEDASMVRLASRFSSLGMKVIRFNGRGAGSGKGLAQEVANLHFSHDVLAVVEAVKKQAPKSPITVIGYSLGGNVVLKMMGDLGALHQDLVYQVIAIAPPIDLISNMERCVQRSSDKDFWMGVYDSYFYQEMRKKIVADALPSKGSIPFFFQEYVAPRFGFEDVNAYFAEGSSIDKIRDIHIPCKILFAQDDPLVLHHLLDKHDLPSHIEVYKTEKGGHVGYIGNPLKPHGFYWLDSLLVNWVLKRDE